LSFFSSGSCVVVAVGSVVSTFWH